MGDTEVVHPFLEVIYEYKICNTLKGRLDVLRSDKFVSLLTSTDLPTLSKGELTVSLQSLMDSAAHAMQSELFKEIHTVK